MILFYPLISRLYRPYSSVTLPLGTTTLFQFHCRPREVPLRPHEPQRTTSVRLNNWYGLDYVCNVIMIPRLNVYLLNNDVAFAMI